MRFLFLASFCLMLLVSCKGGGAGAGGLLSPSNNTSPSGSNGNVELPASQVEVQEIKTILKANPDYQISQGEVQALDESKILNAEEKELLTQLQENK